MPRRTSRIRIIPVACERLEPRRLLSTAGALDPSFGTGGKVTTDFSPAQAYGLGVAVQPDGKYVVAGDVGTDFLITRYNANGTLDTSFGLTRSGKVDIHVGNSGNDSLATAVAIAPDGKIVASGPCGGTDFSIGVIRLLSNGSPDASFGSGGQLIYNGFEQSIESDIAVQNDDKIVLAGSTSAGFLNETTYFGIARFNANGSLDKSFGDNGTQHADFGNSVFVSKIAIDYNGTASSNPRYGTIVAVGQELLDGNDAKVALVRLKPNGSFDDTFDGDGKTSPAFTGYPYSEADSVTIEPDGSLAVAGAASTVSSAANTDLILAHYLANGQLDKAFGNGKGFVVKDFGSRDAGLSVIQGYTGDLLVGDYSFSHFIVVAYTPTGALDTSFTGGGVMTATFPDNGGVIGLAAAPNRRIIAVGGSSKVDLALFYDAAPKASVTSFDTVAGPPFHERVGGVPRVIANVADLVVYRNLFLPYATRVYFTIGGTATPPTIFAVKDHENDYTVSGMTVLYSITPGVAAAGYVDIPPNQTYAIVTLTPANETASEPQKTAIFSIQSSPLYDATTPVNQTLTILGSSTTTNINVSAAADAYVQDGASAATNFGTSQQLFVKKSTAGLNRQAYIKFDLSSFTSISSVQLQLTGALSATGDANLVTQLFAVSDSSWTETGINYNNKPTPASTTPLASATIVDTTKRTYLLDVTAYVQAQFAAGHKTVSFVLMSPNTSNAAMIFDSREAGSTGPQLIVSG